MIDQSDDFERLALVPLSAVCFRYGTEDVRYHQDEPYLSSLNKELLVEPGKSYFDAIIDTLTSKKLKR